MRGKTAGVRRPGRDYAMLAAVVPIFLSVAVLFGIAYRYTARSEARPELGTVRCSERARCLGQTEVGGFPSYVEVIECLRVTVDVRRQYPASVGQGRSPTPVGD